VLDGPGDGDCDGEPVPGELPVGLGPVVRPPLGVPLARGDAGCPVDAADDGESPEVNVDGRGEALALLPDLLFCLATEFPPATRCATTVPVAAITSTAAMAPSICKREYRMFHPVSPVCAADTGTRHHKEERRRHPGYAASAFRGYTRLI
jgi:hypothetical protein